MSPETVRHKNANWSFPKSGEGLEWKHAQTAVLMDIRDELQRLNNIVHCSNALDIPNILRRIDKNTRKVKRKKKAQEKA